jgi:phosphodiester glycosidase
MKISIFSVLVLLIVFTLLSGNSFSQAIIDNDSGAPGYIETGSWSTSGSTGYNGGTYKWANAGSSATATWTANMSTAGDYEIFIWYTPGGNRCTATEYDIFASDGTHTVYHNQQAGGYVFESLGTFPFNAGNNSIRMNSSGSTGGTVVVADAVRFGDSVVPPPPPPIPVEVAPGVYHSEWTLPSPQVLNVLEFDLSDPQYTIEMGFAQAKRNYTSKEYTSTIASRYDISGHDVIAAVNGSHFDSGLYIHGMQGNNGSVIGYPTASWPKEVSVLQESGESFVVSNPSNAVPVVKFADDHEMAADVFNYTRTSNTLAIYTPDWGARTGSTVQSVEVIVEGASLPWRPNKKVCGYIADVRTGSSSLNNLIPADGFVIAACTGAESELLAHASVGEMVCVTVGLNPPELNNGKMFCGGESGWLVKDGAPFPSNWVYSHAPVRHPRTVLAWSGTTYWFVTVDGRQAGYSVGMTYAEMADFLVDSLGVDHAVNLDGGGSTAMVINGSVENCPSDDATTPCTGHQRGVPNILMLIQRDPTTVMPMNDNFISSGRSLAWDEKYTYNPVVSFTPTAPGGDGYVLEVLNPDDEYETASIGQSGDTDYAVEAYIYCDYRLEVIGDGFERSGIFARDNGNANFESTSLGGGNCYTLTYDSYDGRIRASVVIDGVMTDFLEGSPVYYPSDNWRKFRIECEGDQISFLVDDLEIVSETDGTHTRGRAGIGYHEYFSTDSNAQGAHAEAFMVESLGTGTNVKDWFEMYE